jgi:hypothetical protein
VASFLKATVPPNAAAGSPLSNPSPRGLARHDARRQHDVFKQAVAFLQKPIAPEDLRAKVRELLDATG